MVLKWKLKKGWYTHNKQPEGSKAIVLRTNPEQYQEICEYAQKEHISISEAVRVFVTWGLEVVQEGSRTGEQTPTVVGRSPQHFGPKKEA